MLLGLRRSFLLFLVPLLPIFKHVFRMTLKPKPITPKDLPNQFGFDQGVLRHFSTPLPRATVASLAFKSGNLIKVLVPGFEVPFASPSRVGLPSPRFNAW